MNVRNCKLCGRIFNYYSGVPLCQACREKMEGKFQEVKEFIRNNPGVGIQEVSDTCDVEQGQIRQWLREERLELTKDSPIRFQCESCGTEIRSGRYCDKCKYKAINGMQTLVNADNPKPLPKTKLERDKEKMRYL